MEGVPGSGEHHKCISLSIRNGGSLPAFLDALPVLPDVACPESGASRVDEVDVKMWTMASVGWKAFQWMAALFATSSFKGVVESIVHSWRHFAPFCDTTNQQWP